MMNKHWIFYWLYYACKLDTTSCMFWLTFINLKLLLMLLFHQTVTQIREQEELSCSLRPSTSSLGRVVFTKHTTWRTENLAGSWPSRTGPGHPYLMLAEFATGPSNTNRSGSGVTGGVSRSYSPEVIHSSEPVERVHHWQKKVDASLAPVSMRMEAAGVGCFLTSAYLVGFIQTNTKSLWNRETLIYSSPIFLLKTPHYL